MNEDLFKKAGDIIKKLRNDLDPLTKEAMLNLLADTLIKISHSVHDVERENGILNVRNSAMSSFIDQPPKYSSVTDEDKEKNPNIKFLTSIVPSRFKEVDEELVKTEYITKQKAARGKKSLKNEKTSKKKATR